MMSTHQNHKEEVYSEVHEVMAGDKLTDTSGETLYSVRHPGLTSMM